jgi:hypothetical protein
LSWIARKSAGDRNTISSRCVFGKREWMQGFAPSTPLRTAAFRAPAKNPCLFATVFPDPLSVPSHFVTAVSLTAVNGS